MKFSIVINRWAIFYFFVQNLSEWHLSNRKDYNVLWRKELGRFSPEEENALEKFKKIHPRYPFGKLYLGRQFFLEENPWEVLEKKLSQENFTVVKNSFSLLGEKFNKFYNQELPLLNKWQMILQEELNNKSSTASINTILANLYNAPPLSRDIIIYILPSSKNHTGGTGGIVDDKSINLEMSRYPSEKTNHAIGVIWHEITHLYFEKQTFLQLLNKKYSNDSDVAGLIKEATVSSLFPNGALGMKLLNNEGKLLNTKIPEEYTKELIELANMYIKKNKSFDNEYIEKVYSLVSELVVPADNGFLPCLISYLGK